MQSSHACICNVGFVVVDAGPAQETVMLHWFWEVILVGQKKTCSVILTGRCKLDFVSGENLYGAQMVGLLKCRL